MIVAFGPDLTTYYLNNGSASIWCNLPASLVAALRYDSRFTTSKIISLALFPEEGYLLVAEDDMWAASNVPGTMRNAFDANGGTGNVLSICFDAWDLSVFIFLTRKRRMIHRNLPHTFVNAILRHGFSGYNFVTLGAHGSWAYESTTGVHEQFGLSDKVREKLTCSKQVQIAFISPYNVVNCYVVYADGSGAYCVPPQWHATSLNQVLPVTIGFTPRLYTPPMYRITIALGDEGNFYVANGHDADWRAPPELAELLNYDFRFAPDKILSVAFFPNSGYFVASRDAWRSNSVPFVVQCCIDGGGGNDNVAGICFDGKNLNACIVVTKTGRAVHAGLPQSLVDSSVSDVLFGFRYMAFGMNGAWAYETVKPAFAHCSDDLLSADIKARLNDPRLIQTAYLSPYGPHIYVVYTDGSVRHSLPADGKLERAVAAIKPCHTSTSSPMSESPTSGPTSPVGRGAVAPWASVPYPQYAFPSPPPSPQNTTSPSPQLQRVDTALKVGNTAINAVTLGTTIVTGGCVIS